MVIMLNTKAEFDAALKDAGDKLVVVDFTASWCGPCQMIGPKFVALSELAEYAGVCFFKVDVDENDVPPGLTRKEETAEKEGIQAMPTFIFYKNGAKVDTLTGASEAKLKEKLNKNM